MTVRQLKLLVTVSECHQFTSAAKKLHMTQSALSKQIISLEKELSVQLFDRESRKVSLTSEGERVLTYAQRILAEYGALLEKKDAFLLSRQKRISIGAVPVLNQYGITDVLLQFEKDHPDISVEISETTTADIMSDIDSSRIDIGIIRTSHLRDNCYNIYPILEDEYVALVSEQHRLKDFTCIPVEMLFEDRFLLMGDPYYTVFYQKVFSNCQTPISVEYTNMRLETIKTFVRQNRCVTLMPCRVASYYEIPGIKILRLENGPSLYLVAITRKDTVLSPAVSKLICILSDRYDSLL